MILVWSPQAHQESHYLLLNLTSEDDQMKSLEAREMTQYL